MGVTSSSKRTRFRIRDSIVTLALLAIFACAGPTRSEIRRAPPAKNLERLANERSWIREEAAIALGAAKVVEAASPLEGIVVSTGERDYVRAEAARALGRIRASSSLDVLSGVAAERGTPPALALALIEALCQYSGEGPVQALAPLVHHDDLRVQTVAKKEIDARCAAR